MFLEDWFLMYGEIFSHTKPSREEKARFIQEIMRYIKKDEYGSDGSFEKAFLGMCSSKEDIDLIKGSYKQDRYDDSKDFFLELYNKLGMDEK